jgi:hypothetical protein
MHRLTENPKCADSQPTPKFSPTQRSGKRREDWEQGLRLTMAMAVPLIRLGTTGGPGLALGDQRPLVIGDLVARFEEWLPAYMASLC